MHFSYNTTPSIDRDPHATPSSVHALLCFKSCSSCLPISVDLLFSLMRSCCIVQERHDQQIAAWISQVVAKPSHLQSNFVSSKSNAAKEEVCSKLRSIVQTNGHCSQIDLGGVMMCFIPFAGRDKQLCCASSQGYVSSIPRLQVSIPAGIPTTLHLIPHAAPPCSTPPCPAPPHPSWQARLKTFCSCRALLI